MVLPRVCVSRKLESEVELGAEPRTSDNGTQTSVDPCLYH